jgi:predicted transcriptional regulator
MSDGQTLSRALLRRAENTELSLSSLEAIAEVRRWLDQLENKAMISARQKGATTDDIAEALGLTSQAIYYRMRRDSEGTLQRGRGRPRATGT